MPLIRAVYLQKSVKFSVKIRPTSKQKHKKSPENLRFQGFLGGENRICKERSNGIVKATCCLSVTLFHCPVLTAEKTSECHGKNEKGKHNCVSLFRCDLNASLV